MQYSSAALSTLLIYKTEKIYICQVFYYRPNCEQNAAHYQICKVYVDSVLTETYFNFKEPEKLA